MPADEAIHGTDVDESRVRTGPRHAAPRKPLFTRFHMPAGKAIAIAAMPTAVLMGMGLTPTLANADDHSSSKSLTADEYKDCVAAVTGDDASASASATPSPSASTSSSTPTDKSTDKSTDEPSPSASESSATDKTSSSDSGSDDKADSTPTPSATASKSTSTSDGASTATPSPSKSSDNVLQDIGDAITGIFTGDDGSSSSSTASPSASPSPSASATKDSSDSSGNVSDTVKDTTDKVTDTVKSTTEKTEKTVEDTTKKATDAAKDAAETAQAAASATPSPSASSSTDPDNCPVATDEEGGVDNPVTLPDDPWYLNASSLLLKGADYQGIVKVRTANGSVKKVLKYVISDGTDIGDLHQTVKDKQSGKTYHVKAGAGTTSTIRNGKTVMYTESISGNLLGLIPVTFSPDSPPPLNIPLIYFTKVKVVQAGQFGGDLTVPGMHTWQD